ncbi:MAG TPA: right-handed parallel beta-helix repeat-containing protein [Sedimentisphaerales bacterium]|nr:right-handed parallel beta-helix repeat-containing protein [Sedimentisphaerales bacterium]
MRTTLFVLGTLCALLYGPVNAYGTAPIGFAAVNIFGQDGTTGGGIGPTVTVTTKADLAHYAGRTEPYTIIVSGHLSGTGDVAVASNKTIIGAAAGATLSGFGLDIRNQRNIIIRNLTIMNAPVDAIAVRTSHHIWIDHCDLSNCGDGLIDLTQGADYITVSNTILRNHDKVSLVNSGTGNVEDIGKLHVTFHNNWFDTTIQRNPRVGYGKAHIFNNYYSNAGIGGFCIGYHTEALVLVENNYFYRSHHPLRQMYTRLANLGNAESVGNIFNTCTGDTAGTGISFNPALFYDYSFALDAAVNVPAMVQATAGPNPARDFVLVPIPGNGSINRSEASPVLSWTSLPDALAWDIYFGTTASPAYQATQTARSWRPGALAPNTTYYWRVDTVKSGGTVTGQLWRFRTAQTASSNPLPVNGQTETPLRIFAGPCATMAANLRWTPAFGAVAHHVYLGINPVLGPANYFGSYLSPVFAPGLLDYGITYYWRVDAELADGSIVTGPVWQFTTNTPAFAGPGRTEAENMVRNVRYFLEPMSGASGAHVVGGEAGPGVISATFAGESGIYDISIRYLDESDGRSTFSILINDALADMWEATVNNNQYVTRIVRVPLTAGDEIAVQGCPESGELARVDHIDIALVPGANDHTPPTPNPMTWAVPPHATDYDSITMVATAAVDESGVEYYFTCISGNCRDSGWQSSPIYTDTGLPARINPTAIYTYTVKTRDKSANNNQTAPSAPASSMTLPLTTNLIRVNFQPAAADVPAGYLPDFGDTYAVRANGLSYGWNVSHADQTRERNANPDQRLDTICHFRLNGFWEIALPNGTYNVEVTIGDPSFASMHTIRVEGVSYWTNLSLGANQFATMASTITLSDGRLRIDPGAATDRATRICHVVITAVGAADTTPPVPNPTTWAAAPTAISSSEIAMTAFTASDASGVEYFFECIAGGCNSSGWQNSSTFIDTGLANNASYTYRVRTRDKSTNRNETGWSSQASAATPRYSCTPLAADRNADCQVDFLDYAWLASGWAGGLPDFADLRQFASQWLSCNRSPANECWL